jgi:glyoxylase-like metal-dependent hydrolase (beta-lactamase superfamily II)
MIALWRERDRTLIAADAFITTDVESAYAALTQKPELQGPPTFLTIDWREACESVRQLAALRPETVITGHGRAMRGPEMLAKLDELATRFEEIAIPEHGKYVNHPARIEDGTAYCS